MYPPVPPRTLREAGAVSGQPQHSLEHGRRELAGERVLLARVEAAENRVGTDSRLGAVSESRLRPRAMPVRGEREKRPVPGEGPEGDDHASAIERRQLPCEVRDAPVALLGRGT